MAHWAQIVGSANNPTLWAALAWFGKIGDATQAPSNSQSENLRFIDAATTRFGKDFRAMFEWPWRNWHLIAKKANEVGDAELAVQVFFVAWMVQNQMMFDMNTSAIVGFEKPGTEILRLIASEAHSAASAAPSSFAVVERVGEPPVPREAITRGTSQILSS